ncbi:MAG: hypothetical protein KKA07_18265 [Bacteroidetes bacterium]|nr:hypothetical protein [Bacteroidota bacterium]MBU1721016.1 hypothetical protein [Bacteroidota bacterium]
MNPLRKTIVTAFSLITFFLTGNAQNQLPTHQYFNKHNTYGFILHSDGWGVNFRKGYYGGGVRKIHGEFDLVSLKHPKEMKYFNPAYPDAKGYVFGKMNGLSVFRAGFGMQDVLYTKARRANGVEINYHFTGGFSCGLMKPVYLYIIYYTSSEAIIVEEKYDPTVHYPDNIFGRAPTTKGLSEIKFKPGIYLKSGMGFDYAAFSDEIRCLETGFVLDYYFSEVPVMAMINNKSLYITFYLNFQIGSRK